MSERSHPWRLADCGTAAVLSAMIAAVGALVPATATADDGFLGAVGHGVVPLVSDHVAMASERVDVAHIGQELAVRTIRVLGELHFELGYGVDVWQEPRLRAVGNVVVTQQEDGSHVGGCDPSRLDGHLEGF